MPFPDLIHPQLAAYQSQVTLPGDFHDFWSATITEARNSGGPAKLNPAPTTLKAIEVQDVTFPGFGGHPIKGWLMLPRQRQGRLPLVVQFVGYGGGRSLPHEGLHWAASGFAYFRMDTRGQGSVWSTGDTPDPVGANASIPGFMTRGVLDRHDYYYRRVFTDGVRALDALSTLPDIDPGRIALCGGSQGGGITLAVGGLDPRVAAIMPDVPFLCDFPRALRMAVRDPYLELVRYLAQHRDHKARVMETLAYFDGVNFARQSKAPALFSVALMDDICPPSTVYGTFNAYAGTRTMEEYEFNNHEGGQGFQEARQMAWLTSLFGM